MLDVRSSPEVPPRARMPDRAPNASRRSAVMRPYLCRRPGSGAAPETYPGGETANVRAASCGRARARDALGSRQRARVRSTAPCVSIMPCFFAVGAPIGSYGVAGRFPISAMTSRVSGHRQTGRSAATIGRSACDAGCSGHSGHTLERPSNQRASVATS